MSTDTQAPVESTVDASELPVLLGLSEMAQMFSVAKQTVYRWRVPRGGAPAALPEPLLTVSRTPMWDQETILSFARQRGLEVDQKALAKIRRDQGK